MGIEPFLVASSVRCVIAQRLARVLCTGCKKAVTLEAERAARARAFDIDHDIAGYEAGGCPRCSGSGYRGRVGIYEIMPVSDEIRDLALHSASSDRIMETARARGHAHAARGRLREGQGGRHRRRRSAPRTRRIGARTQVHGHPLPRKVHMSVVDFADIVLAALERRASDIHLTAGAAPSIRVRGRLFAAGGLPGPGRLRHARDRLLDHERHPAPAV